MSSKVAAPASAAPAAAAAPTSNVKKEPQAKEPQAKKENMPKKEKAAYEDSDDNFSISSSDSEDAGPPPMIQIERGDESSGVGALKETFLTQKQIEKEKTEIAEGLGKENLVQFKETFEKGPKSETKPERERLTVSDREKFANFKTKFEHIDEELARKEAEFYEKRRQEVEGAGKEKLVEAKTRFEAFPDEFIPERNIEVERSEEDKRRVKQTFVEGVQQEDSRDCSICGKMVYPVEKVQFERRVFHRACFKCNDCQKPLNDQNCETHDEKLYCRLHLMKILKPEQFQAGEFNHLIDDQGQAEAVNNPNAAAVVKSGFKGNEDIEIGSLRNKKDQWQSSAEQGGKVEKKTEVEAELFQQGKVKSRLGKFTGAEGPNGQETGENEEPEDGNEANRDPNIIRETRKKEQLKFEVGSIKSKWEKGDMERPEEQREDRASELEEIKKGVQVKERFKERTGAEEDNTQRKSVLDNEQIDFTAAGSVRERFQKGEIFQEQHDRPISREDIRCADLSNFKERFEKGDFDEAPIGRTAVDVRCAELGHIRSNFEKAAIEIDKRDDLSNEEKRKIIEEEFKRYKKEKRIKSEKERREMEEQLQNVPSIPQEQKRDRRAAGGESDDDDDFEVKTVLSKFKCMESRKDEEVDKKPRPKRQITPPPEGGIGIDPEALKARFEQSAEAKDPKEEEERRKRLEEEFKLLKDEKERLKQLEAEDDDDEEEVAEKEELPINPEHAAKMKQRWEKIQKKEAKKAQKDKARRPLPGYSLPTPTPEFCFECEKKVYMTEKIECNRRVIHRSCFRCKHCFTNLRMETCAMGPDGIYCTKHYKELFNNMSKILYDPRRARECAPA